MKPLAVSLSVALLAFLPAASPWAQEPVPVPAPVPDSAAPTEVDASTLRRADVPWAVGERLEYDVAFGKIRAGHGLMEVRAVEPIRGRPAYHIFFQVRGGIPFYRVNDVFQSWIDTASLASLRFIQELDEGPKERERRYEIYPERRVYVDHVRAAGEEQPSVETPVDDGSFLYFIRTVPLEVGKSYTFNNYFRPDRNPVKIRVIRRERVTVPAGTFDAIVIQPSIKTSGIFGEEGRAEVWLSDDDQRMMLQMKSRLKFGSLNLYLKSHRRGGVDAGSAGR
jgi:hypothetical protein